MIKKSRATEFDTFADDLLAERSARPLVIIGASRIDDLMVELLRAFLLPKKAQDKNQDELLEGDNAPLSTFSARSKMCRRLGLVDDTLFLAIDRLRVLRNFSAHSTVFDYSKSPVREHLTELRKHIGGRRSYKWTSKRYFDEAPQAIGELQCLLLTICALLEAIREKVKRLSGNKSALKIAAR